MLGTNQDLAEEYTYTKDEGIERNLSNISNAKTQTKMIDVVTNEFVKQ